jgi:hypothetical protein
VASCAEECNKFQRRRNRAAADDHTASVMVVVIELSNFPRCECSGT